MSDPPLSAGGSATRVASVDPVEPVDAAVPWLVDERPANPNAATAENTAESATDTTTAMRVILETERMP